MERNWLNRTRRTAVRVNESAFERLQSIADAEQKPLGECCRDTLIALASRRQPSPVEFGLLAEMTATQAIVTHLLCTGGETQRHPPKRRRRSSIRPTMKSTKRLSTS
jgi:hypothetical protein